jgi:hypothetical protein
MTHAEIAKRMRELRKRVKPDRISVREMVNEGRRGLVVTTKKSKRNPKS